MSRGFVLSGIAVLLMAVVPFYLDGYWMQLGLFAFVAAIAAVGLAIQVGVAGQLSLAHAVFLGSGAYLYALLAGDDDDQVTGLGWPTPIAAVTAVVLTGLLGAVFSPIAGRLRGLYLAVASFGLVFIAQHFLLSATGMTGGPAGRAVPPLSIAGLAFDDTPLVVFGVPLGMLEKLWFLALAIVILTYIAGRRIVRGRPGLALHMMRESELAASAMGIRVGRWKAAAFVVAAVYGGMAGVLLALASQWVVPDSFGFLASVDFLVMVIIGGLGSIRGAIAGAVFISAIPLLLERYAEVLPFLAGPGGAGLDTSLMAVFLYGGLLIVVIMVAPGGLNALLSKIVDKPWRPREGAGTGA